MVPALFLLQSNNSLIGMLFGGFFLLVILALVVLVISGWWKVFTKAGEPGWLALIPVVNLFILLTKIAGRPAWWILLLFIPLVNIIILLLVSIDVAKAFGQGAAFGVILLWLLAGIGYVVLGWGKYQFVGPGAAR